MADRPAAAQAGRIAALYVAVSLVYIVFSDRVVDAVVADPATRSTVQTLKGWAFVVLSGLLIWWLSWRYLSRAMARERDFRVLAENASDAVLRVGADGGIAWASPSTAALLGIAPDDIVGADPLGWLHPDDVEGVREALASASGSDLAPALRRVRRQDGDYRWISATARRVSDGRGRPDGWVLGLHDVQSEVEAHEALVASEAQYRLLAENATDVVLRVGAAGRVRWVSPSVTSMLGWDPAALLGREVADLVHPDEVTTLRQAGDSLAGDADAHRRTVRAATRSGEWRWVAVAVRPVAPDDPAGADRLVSVRDVQAEVEALQRLEHHSHHDPLTNLPNRDHALSLLDDLLREEAGAGRVAVLHVGVDDFAKVNDALSRDAGDRMLVEVAQRLGECVTGRGYVARASGDQFLVVQPGLSSVDDAAILADTVCARVRTPLQVGGHDLVPTVSAGVVVADAETDPAHVLRNAELAMRRAKEAGRNRWAVLDEEAARAAERRLPTESALRRALHDEQVHAWFQPIVALSDRRLVGVEALARWVDPEHGVRPAADFVAVAEHSDLVGLLDRTVLAEAARVAATLPPAVSVAVNLSAATVTDGHLVESFEAALREAGQPAGRLHAEITETLLLRLTPATRGALLDLSALGVDLYVDDFGTGYSSITHLRDLPVRGLKLDRSFTQRLDDPGVERLVEGLLGLARGLGLDTVAEGVETPEQARVLARQGWARAQGYLVSPAVPAQDLARFLPGAPAATA